MRALGLAARVTLTGQVVVGLVFWGFAMAGWLSLGLTIGFLFAFLGFLGFTNPNAAALAMAPFAKNAGTASSLLSLLQWGSAAIGSGLVAAMANGRLTYDNFIAAAQKGDYTTLIKVLQKR